MTSEIDSLFRSVLDVETDIAITFALILYHHSPPKKHITSWSYGKYFKKDKEHSHVLPSFSDDFIYRLLFSGLFHIISQQWKEIFVTCDGSLKFANVFIVFSFSESKCFIVPILISCWKINSLAAGP